MVRTLKQHLPGPGGACCTLLLLLLLCGPLAALEVPQLKGRVNDLADMLSSQSEQEIESMLKQLEQTDSTQIVLLTIPSLAGDVLESFSMKVVEKWKIGQKGLDNGALLLIARDERKIRIEVGYGLEGKLTDLICGRIISREIVPRFRRGQMDEGIRAGITAMVAAVRGEYTASSTPSGKKQNADPYGMIFLLMFLYVFIGKIFFRKQKPAAIAGGILSPIIGIAVFPQLGFWLLALIPVGMFAGLISSTLSTAAGSTGYIGTGGFGHSSGGFGGGFGGFGGGGGGFGGGGASGGW